MANEKFSALPPVLNSTLADVIPAIQAGTSVQETLSQVVSLSQSNIIQHYAGNPNGNVSGNKYGFCWDITDSVLYICTTSGNAASAIWTVAGSVNVSFNAIKIQIISSSGSYVPTTGLHYAISELLAGGGAGGGTTGTSGQGVAGGGGGSSGYGRKIYTASQIGSSATVTIGLGGAPGSPGANGGNGGNSSFVPSGTGTSLTVNGGSGGIAGTSSSSAAVSYGGSGGLAGSGGDINIAGTQGERGYWLASGAFAYGGSGASCIYGVPATGSIIVSNLNASEGSNASGYGAGGSAAVGISTGMLVGGSGSPGVFIVTEFLA